MGINLNVNTKNENEFNQQLQMYIAQGYNMQSNFNGTAILKKKSYSVGLLIVLIIFFFPAAVIYYLVSSDDVVTITNNEQATSDNFNAKYDSESFDSYCEECGHGLFKDSKFCPGCGKDLSVTEEESTEAISEENEVIEQVKDRISKCGNCGTELNDENKYCSNCGEIVTSTDE